MVLHTPGRSALSGFVIAITAFVPLLIYHLVEPIYILVDPIEFLVFTMGTIAVLSWFLLVLLEPDIPEYAVLWVVVPLPVIPLLQRQFFPWWAISDYPVYGHIFAVAAAGLLGIGLTLAVRYALEEYDHPLGPILPYRHVLILLVLLVPIAGVGLHYAAEPETTITGVDPVFNCGDRDDYPDRIVRGCETGLSHGLAVTFAPDGGAHRVVVETPAGETYDRWYSGDQLDRDSATSFVRIHTFEQPAVGTYHVRIEDFWGHTIDEATVEIERQSTAEVTNVVVETTDVTTLEIEVTYEGDFAIELDPLVTRRSDVQIELDDRFRFDGDGTDTVTATVVDDRGQPMALEEGTYEVEFSFRRIGVSEWFEIEIAG